jgi:hypothetical protein
VSSRSRAASAADPRKAVQPDVSGPAAPPRSNGELLFDQPWQARAFALALSLLERDGVGWDAFRPHLVAAIAAHPAAGYYECVVEALEGYLQARHP